MAQRAQRVTPLELFFDLVFVFAITQVTLLMSADPTWHGIGRGLLVLAALWWAWTGYAWLTNTLALRRALALLPDARRPSRTHVHSIRRTTTERPGWIGPGRLVTGLGMLALLPAVLELSALTALALVTALCCALIAYDVVHYREDRTRVREARP
jgi:low temperature requirement protein LtrA